MDFTWQPQPSDLYRIKYPPLNNGVFSVTNQTTIDLKLTRPKISSLIHKFEALCLPANATFLEQSPARKPQGLQKHKAPIETLRERNSTVFSPTKKKNVSRTGGVSSKDNAFSGQEDVFNTPLYRCGEIKHHDASRVYQTHMSHGARSLPHPTGDYRLERPVFAPHSRTRMTSDNSGSTVRDKIKFYEGCTGNAITSCKLCL